MAKTIPRRYLAYARVAKKAYDMYKRNPIINKGVKRAGKAVFKKIMRLRGGSGPTPPRTAARRMRFRRRARAVRGVYAGSVPKPTKPVYNKKFARYGIEFKQEKHQVVEDKDCVYVGHGVALAPSYSVVVGAAFRALLTKVGIDITNWTDIGLRLGTGTGTILVQYVKTDGQPEQNFYVAYGAASYSATLDALVAGFKAAQAANKDWPILFKRMLFYSTDVNDNAIPDAILNLESFKVEFEALSKIKVQNRTLARKDEGETGDDQDDATNIEANPVTGKLYVQTLWKNGFELKSPYRANIVGYDPMNCDEDGLIAAAAFIMDRDDTLNVARKPPAAYYLGEKLKCSTVKMDPGQIKDHTMYFSCKMGFNNFLQKLQPAIDGLTVDRIQQFGKAAVFGLEKECTIGRLNGDDTYVRIGCQVDQTYRAFGNSAKGYAQPIFSVKS